MHRFLVGLGGSEHLQCLSFALQSCVSLFNDAKTSVVSSKDYPRQRGHSS